MAIMDGREVNLINWLIRETNRERRVIFLDSDKYKLLQAWLQKKDHPIVIGGGAYVNDQFDIVFNECVVKQGVA